MNAHVLAQASQQTLQDACNRVASKVLDLNKNEPIPGFSADDLYARVEAFASATLEKAIAKQSLPSSQDIQDYLEKAHSVSVLPRMAKLAASKDTQDLVKHVNSVVGAFADLGRSR